MQVPSAATIATTRYFVATAARAVGVIAVGAAAFLIVWQTWSVFWHVRALLQPPPGFWLRQTLQFLGPIAAAAGLGAVLLRYADRLACLIAPDAKAVCTRCGYSLAGSTAETCPECGLSHGRV